MAAPPLPAVFSSGPGKSLALVPGGGQVQPLLQGPPQPSVTMVRVVTSTPNGYSVPPAGGAAEASGELRGNVPRLKMGFIILAPDVEIRCYLDTRILLHLVA